MAPDRPQTLRQAKRAYLKSSGRRQLSPSEIAMLERRAVLQERADRIKEREIRRKQNLLKREERRAQELERLRALKAAETQKALAPPSMAHGVKSCDDGVQTIVKAIDRNGKPMASQLGLGPFLQRPAQSPATAAPPLAPALENSKQLLPQTGDPQDRHSEKPKVFDDEKEKETSELANRVIAGQNVIRQNAASLDECKDTESSKITAPERQQSDIPRNDSPWKLEDDTLFDQISSVLRTATPVRKRSSFTNPSQEDSGPKASVKEQLQSDDVDALFASNSQIVRELSPHPIHPETQNTMVADDLQSPAKDYHLQRTPSNSRVQRRSNHCQTSILAESDHESLNFLAALSTQEFNISNTQLPLLSPAILEKSIVTTASSPDENCYGTPFSDVDHLDGRTSAPTLDEKESSSPSVSKQRNRITHDITSACDFCGIKTEVMDENMPTRPKKAPKVPQRLHSNSCTDLLLSISTQDLEYDTSFSDAFS